jgi:hypothetical protein
MKRSPSSLAKGTKQSHSRPADHGVWSLPMIVYCLGRNLVHEFGRTNPKRVRSRGVRTACADFMPCLSDTDRSREGPKSDLAIAMLLTPALPLRSWPATPEAFDRWRAACLTTLNECRPRLAPKRRAGARKTRVHVRLIVVVSATNYNSIDSAEGTQTKSMITFSRACRTGTRTIKRNAARRRGWANSAPPLRRDGRTSNTQSHRLVT